MLNRWSILLYQESGELTASVEKVKSIWIGLLSCIQFVSRLFECVTHAGKIPFTCGALVLIQAQKAHSYLIEERSVCLVG